jgi:hypothetical protein
MLAAAMADTVHRTRRLEEQAQRAVFEHIRLRRERGTFAFHVPNGGYRTPVEAAIMKGQGVRAGVPDIVICRDGKFFALEIKAGHGGRLSPPQSDSLAALEAAGATVAVAAGIDEALQVLERWGILRAPAGHLTAR